MNEICSSEMEVSNANRLTDSQTGSNIDAHRIRNRCDKQNNKTKGKTHREQTSTEERMNNLAAADCWQLKRAKATEFVSLTNGDGCNESCGDCSMNETDTCTHC